MKTKKWQIREEEAATAVVTEEEEEEKVAGVYKDQHRKINIEDMYYEDDDYMLQDQYRRVSRLL